MTRRTPPADTAPVSLSYEEAKTLAAHAEASVRRGLAQRTDAPPEILYYLAEDPDAGVRRAIARNTATPVLAHLTLAEDGDADIRADLAERIARLSPGLTPDEQDRARRAAYRVLDLLVRDQVPRVRQVLSEALKDVAEAPPLIINHLARDAEMAVCTPVLEYSPVLRDEDLLELIGENPASEALAAISRRHRVGMEVADAIAGTDDSAAIAALLANKSAQIREDTLDGLIDRADQHPAWHEPLVERPSLPRGAAERLAHIVADRLITVLLEREDLLPETLCEVQRVVHRRLEDGDLDAHGLRAAGHVYDVVDSIGEARPDNDGEAAVAEVLHRVSRMMELGSLTPGVMARAIRAGDVEFVAAALALRTGINRPAVLEAITAASGRAIAACVWKAEFPPNISVLIQSRLAHIPPQEVVVAADEEGFGLTEAEMDWQIEMFTRLAKEGTL